MSETLSPEELSKALEGIAGWEILEKEIQKTFEFEDFKGALDFVNKVGALAEEANHHPEIEINYNKVEIELSTHTAGGITQKDMDLAKQIEGVYA